MPSQGWLLGARDIRFQALGHPSLLAFQRKVPRPHGHSPSFDHSSTCLPEETGGTTGSHRVSFQDGGDQHTKCLISRNSVTAEQASGRVADSKMTASLLPCREEGSRLQVGMVPASSPQLYQPSSGDLLDLRIIQVTQPPTPVSLPCLLFSLGHSQQRGAIDYLPEPSIQPTFPATTLRRATFRLKAHSACGLSLFMHAQEVQWEPGTTS